jgi:hypothetical protein
MTKSDREAMKLYYFPIHAKYCDRAPLKFNQPDSEWKEFSEEVARHYPNTTFYVDIRTPDEIKESVEKLKAMCEEFFL